MVDCCLVAGHCLLAFDTGTRRKKKQERAGGIVCGRSTLIYEVIYNKSKIINVDRVVFRSYLELGSFGLFFFLC